jgi:hypothetical protein
VTERARRNARHFHDADYGWHFLFLILGQLFEQVSAIIS